MGVKASDLPLAHITSICDYRYLSFDFLFYYQSAYSIPRDSFYAPSYIPLSFFIKSLLLNIHVVAWPYFKKIALSYEAIKFSVYPSEFDIKL